MPSSGYREEVFNVLLALILHKRGIITAPERSFRQALEERRHVPDVLVLYRGLRTVIEGKVNDKKEAEGKALSQAKDRVTSGVAHVGIALLYPREIRKIMEFSEVQEYLNRCSFKVAVYSESGEVGWAEGEIDYLSDVLRSTYEQLVREDVVIKAVDILNKGIEQFAQKVYTQKSIIQRSAEILGIRELPKRNKNSTENEE